MVEKFESPLVVASLQQTCQFFHGEPTKELDELSAVFAPVEFEHLLVDSDAYLKSLDEKTTTTSSITPDVPVNKDVVPANGETNAASTVQTPTFGSEDAFVFFKEDSTHDQKVTVPAPQDLFAPGVEKFKLAEPKPVVLVDSRTVPKVSGVVGDRDWKVFQRDSVVAGPEVVPKIHVRTSKEPLSSQVPLKIYSSLVYEVHVRLSALHLMGIQSGSIHAALSCLEADMSPCSSKNNQAVLLNHITGDLFIDSQDYVGKLKFRFNPRLKMTYHQSKKEYRLLLTLSEGKKTAPFLKMVSATVRIYGRKLKRKSSSGFPPLKRRKLTGDEQKQVFYDKLQNLLEFCKGMDPQEKEESLRLLFEVGHQMGLLEK